MHLIIGAILALGGLVWAVNHLASGAAEAKGTYRRLKWQGRAGKDPLADLEDPRLAAVVLLGQALRYSGEITSSERERLARLVETEFRTPPQEADEIVAQGLYLLGQKTDASNELAKILRPVLLSCTESEKADLIGLLKDVTAWHGAANELQLSLIDRTRHRLLGA